MRMDVKSERRFLSFKRLGQFRGKRSFMDVRPWSFAMALEALEKQSLDSEGGNTLRDLLNHTVLRPTQVGTSKSTKVYERRSLRELCKLTP